MSLPTQSAAAGRSTAARPLIGLTSYATRAAWGVWDVDATLLPQKYVDAVVTAGGTPVLLPALPGLLGDVLDRLDGVLVTGGPDVDPARYGAEPGPDTQPPSRVRDAAEAEVVAAAAARGLPLLGICRGMQVLNVARGGTLVQHLPDVVGTDLHCPAPGRYGWHDVRIMPGTRLASVLTALDEGDHGRRVPGADASGEAGTDAGWSRGRGPDGGTDAGPGEGTELPPIQRSVPTYHHQAADQVGSGLVAAAWAADGVVEAVEDPRLPFCIGVQWHPEVGDDLSLFIGLVEAARSRSRQPAGAR